MADEVTRPEAGAHVRPAQWLEFDRLWTEWGGFSIGKRTELYSTDSNGERTKLIFNSMCLTVRRADVAGVDTSSQDVDRIPASAQECFEVYFLPPSKAPLLPV